MTLAVAGAIAVTLLHAGTAQAADCTATFVGDIDDNWFTVIDPPGPDNTNTNWTADQDPPNDDGDVACIPAGQTAVIGGSSQGAAALIGELQVAAGGELVIQATDSPTNNQLGRLHAENDSVNNGTIRLRTVAGAGDASLHIDESLQPDTRTLDNNGTLVAENVAGTGSATIQGNIDNDGTVTVNHPDTIYENTGHDQTITNDGTFTINTLLRMGPNALYEFHQVAGTLNGNGTLQLDRGSDTFRMGGGTVFADIVMDAGTLAFDPAAAGTSGAITLIQGGVPGTEPVGAIPAGWIVTLLTNAQGTASLKKDSDWTNNGKIVYEQSGGFSSGGIYAVDGSAATTETFTNNGTLEVEQTGGTGNFNFRGDIVNGPNGTMTFDEDIVQHRPLEDGGRAQDFTNAGAVTFEAGSLFDNRLASGYVQTGGSTALEGTIDTTIGPVDIQGGTLSGSGTVDGDLDSSGTVRPGTSPGALSVDGDYTQSPGGTVVAELAGTALAQYDRLVVSGDANLGGNGTLDLDYPGGFQPATGNAFTVLTADEVLGEFSTIADLDAPGPTTLAANYGPEALTLNATGPSAACTKATTKVDKATKKAKKAAKKAKKAKGKAKKKKAKKKLKKAKKKLKKAKAKKKTACA